MALPETHMKDSGGTWREVQEIHMKDSGSTWRNVQEGWMKDSAGTWRQFFAAFLHQTTVTVGAIRSYTYSHPWYGVYYYYALGYDGGADPLSLSSFGSIASATFTDHGSNSRTITSVYKDDWTGKIYFTLSGTSIPNTDTTFIQITINSTIKVRSAATYNGSGPGSSSYWSWAHTLDPWAGSPDELTID